ncbi:MAG: ABC transporter ATP-binding protein [Phycisphaerales bacterium]|nr:ABC transporter ATP-binding protein [Phycisphaerales bacterium]
MLELRDLRKSFGPHTAVDGLSLSVARGEVLGFLGPNGAGKSTTIGMAVGLLRPDSGTVELEGLGPPTSPAVRARLGLAPQSLAIYDDLTGRENLAFFGKLQGLSGEPLRRRIAESLELVGLAPRAGDRAGTYSGGMKRRLNLAAAIVHDPPMLLLDEPTAGVDPQSRNSILDLVRELAARGKTVIYTTHYMEEAQKLCSRVAIIDHGKLLAVGPVEELVSRFGGESVVTIRRGPGEDAAEELIRTADPVAELQRALSAGGVTGVRIDRPDLETVFLSLTGRRLRD